MDLRLAARAKDGPEIYEPLSRHSLRWEMTRSGSGNSAEVKIHITADSGFSGIIRIAMRAETPDPSARFYLPGFMFGTNRGSAPLVTEKRRACGWTAVFRPLPGGWSAATGFPIPAR